MKDAAAERTDANQDAQLDRLIDFLGIIALAIGKNKALVHFLNHPAIPGSEKKKALAVLTRKEVPDSFGRLMDRLINMRVVSHIPEIAAQFKAMRDARKGIKRVVVKSAAAMSEHEKTALTKKISSLLKKEAVPVFQVQPDLIAGYAITIDSVVIENSLVSNLHALAAELSDFHKG